MFVVLKSNAGIDFQVGDKTISLLGRGVLNEVSKAELDALKKVDAFKRKADRGFIVVSDKADSSKVQDDLKQEALDKQKASIKNNEKSNNVKVTKD